MAARPSGNRRALGDIGNIVGSLSTTYIVAKGQQQTQKQPRQTTQVKNLKDFNGPMTRFGAELAKRNQVLHGKVAGEKENVKENPTASSKKKKRSHSREVLETKCSGTMKKEEEERESQKKKLERQESDCYSDSSMSMETAESSLDSKENLHNPIAESDERKLSTPKC